MDLLTLAKKRCSIRSYKPDKVEDEKLAAILEAGRVAPTAVNYQPVKIIAVRSDEGIELLKQAYKSFGAPLALIVCADHSAEWVRPRDGKPHGVIDATIVTDHMMLAAADLGLSSVWVCNFDPDKLREIYDIPEQLEPVNMLMIGYADAPPKSPDRHGDERKPLDEMVVYA